MDLAQQEACRLSFNEQEKQDKCHKCKHFGGKKCTLPDMECEFDDFTILKHHYYFESKIGKRFGKLTVLDYCGYCKSNNQIRYLCKCDCGKYTLKISCNIPNDGITKTGRELSCGCLSPNYKYPKKKPYKEINGSLREDARKAFEAGMSYGKWKAGINDGQTRIRADSHD